MQYAIELYFDPETENQLLDLSQKVADALMNVELPAGVEIDVKL